MMTDSVNALHSTEIAVRGILSIASILAVHRQLVPELPLM